LDILTDQDEWQADALDVCAPVELKFVSGIPAETGVIEGWAATFGNVDSFGDSILPGAFAETLAKHKADGTAPAMLWNHSGAAPIGKWTAMGEDAKGLRVRGALNLNTQRGNEALAHLKNSDVTGLSIGFQVPPGGQARGTNGASRILRRIHLHEASVVATPADTASRVVSVKSLGSRGDLEDLLHSTGLPRGAARKIAAVGWPALAGDDDDEISHNIAAAIRASAARLRG
jgi:HK97 family phage prohead protease